VVATCTTLVFAVLPGGSSVAPNHELGSALADALAPLVASGSGRDINVNLFLDGRVVTRTVVKRGLEAQSVR
jgi:hypothetical protein